MQRETPQKVILVVHDHTGLRTFLERLLTAEGFHVITCADGQAALTRVTTDHPHLVISDSELPFLGGRQFLQYRQQWPGWQDLPVILLTADIPPPCNATDLDPTTRLLGKPFSIHKLVELVRTLLEDSSA